MGTVCEASATPGAEALKVPEGRRVVLWPDNDEAGRKHMDRIAAALQGVASEVRIHRWPDAPEKGDAADHLAVLSGGYQARARLEAELESAPLALPTLRTSGANAPNGQREHKGRGASGRFARPASIMK